MSATAKYRLMILLGILLTAMLLVAHQFLPSRTLQLLPDNEALRFLYADTESGGGNQVEWVDFETNHWRCTRDPELPSHYCGFNLALSGDFIQGMDLSGFDWVKLRLTLQTEKPTFSVLFRNYNPVYSNPDDGDSAQYININIRQKDVHDELLIGLHEFRVADWWLHNRDIARQYLQPEFNNVTVFGINLGDNLPPGDNDVIIHSLVLEGEWISAEAWYLTILSFWMGVIFLILVWQTLQLSRRARGTEQKYVQLASEHRRLRDTARQLQMASEKDALTGLLNRRGMQSALEKVRQLNVGCSLIVMDIDHFKRINDRRGHVEGDNIIRQVAHILESNTREQDLVARWGGEEFLLLSPATEIDQAQKLAEKIRQTIFQANFGSEGPLAVTASFGVTSFAPGETFDTVFERADQALYEAKNQGRNCTMVKNS